MVNKAPSPIREYYIAYFDILGYKDFFSSNPERASEFLAVIHNAIQQASGFLTDINNSPIASTFGKIDIKVKIFSDNFLLCLEVTENAVESIRILTLLKCVADIQRNFIIEYGLFVRGGITKGLLSFNDDYVFGDGLIKVVEMESNAKYPRIIVDLIIAQNLLVNRFYSDEEASKAIELENRVQTGEKLNEDESIFFQTVYNRTRMLKVVLDFTNALVFQWPDGFIVLNYLYLYQLRGITSITPEELSKFVDLMKQLSPIDYQQIMKTIGTIEKSAKETQPNNYEMILAKHKEVVEKQLKKFGSNQDLPTANIREAELRESILRKYMWVMAFHNFICMSSEKSEYKIYTNCNCDTRFLKLTIEVVE